MPSPGFGVFPEIRDPAFPGDSDAPDSIAAMKMARRTDAGLRQSFGLGSSGAPALWWLLLLAAAVLVVAVLLALR